MAEIIPAGTTLANSADFTLADGANATLTLVPAAGGPAVPADCQASVQIKIGTAYFQAAVMDGNNPIQVLSAPGTFRVQKKTSTTSFSVDKS